MSDLIKALAEPFPASDIEWRIQSSGFKNDKYWAMVLAYVDNRAIQDRLDEVCGPLGWQNEYKAGPQGGIICGLSIWCDTKKQWVTKWDGSDNTQIEAVKGGLSASMKRSGSQWGIGRYLYNLDAMFAQTSTDNKRNQAGWQSAKESKTNKYFNWQTPTLPEWALPLSEDTKRWIDAVKSDPAVLDQLTDANYRAFIKKQAGV